MDGNAAFGNGTAFSAAAFVVLFTLKSSRREIDKWRTALGMSLVLNLLGMLIEMADG